MYKAFISIIYVLLLSSCASLDVKDFVGSQNKASFALSNLDKELEVRVYDLQYVDATSLFFAIRPYLPREATLQFVSGKNMLVYADQTHRIIKFEDMLNFLDSELFVRTKFNDSNIAKLGELMLALRSEPFYQSEKTASHDSKVRSYFIKPVPGNHFTESYMRHFDTWFASCTELKVAGRVHYDISKEYQGEVVYLSVAKSECVDKMNLFLTHLRTHNNTNVSEDLVEIDLISRKSEIKERLKHLYPTLYEWRTPRAVQRQAFKSGNRGYLAPSPHTTDQAGPQSAVRSP